MSPPSNTGKNQMQPRPQIIFDAISKTVAILFGDEMVTLSTPFRRRADAIAAAMDECARRGWLGEPDPDPGLNVPPRDGVHPAGLR
jgi:hypothetical protein